MDSREEMKGLRRSMGGSFCAMRDGHTAAQSLFLLQTKSLGGQSSLVQGSQDLLA